MCKYWYLYMFFCLLLSTAVSLSCPCWLCLLPMDSSMYLSVTECNWFCQGQSIAPRQASSAGDKGCITVKLCTAYRNNTVYLCVQVSGEIEVMWLKQSDLSSHLTSTVIDSMNRWKTAARAKPTNCQGAKLQEVWELGQSNLWMLIMSYLITAALNATPEWFGLKPTINKTKTKFKTF